MRALFGVVSLLVVLAVLGLFAARQLKAPIAPATGLAAGDAQRLAPAANPREQSQQVQERVKTDVSQALEQGAAARRDGADK